MSIKKQLSKLSRLAIMAIAAAIFSTSAIWAQGQKVTGKVTDGAGEPLAGVYVLVQNQKTNGTATDYDGKFTITAPANGNLQFSMVGYKSAVVAINGRSVVNVSLQEDATMLDDVVVVGFGTQKKVNLTGAVSSVDVSKAFDSKPVTDVAKGLQGVVPGLTITFATNDLGSSPTMRIRGTGSVNGDNKPLILLDGVEIPDLSFVNPDNIKDISVLKDAASSSIYGTRAAWGVVLITTKDGSSLKDNVKVTYSNNFSWNTAIGLPKYNTTKKAVLAQLNEGILAQKNTNGARIEGFGMYYDELIDPIANWFDNLKSRVKGEVWQYGRDYTYNAKGVMQSYRISDPNKELYHTAFQHNHNLNIAGNSGKTNYNIGVGYAKENSNMRMSDAYVQRVNANISTNTQLYKWLNVGTKLMYMEKQHHYPYGYEASSSSMNLIAYTMRFPTWFPFGISDGGPEDNAITQDAKGLYWRHGNGYLVGQPMCTSKDEYLSLGANVKIDIIKGLSFKADYTRSQYNYTNKSAQQPVWVANWWGAWAPRTAYTAKDINEHSFIKKISNTFNAYFDYDLTVAKDHNIAVKLGANAEDYFYNYNYMRSDGIQNPDVPTMNLTDGKDGKAYVNENMKDRATAGFFGRLNYDYKGKYLLELNGRYDGSSSFRKGKKWAFFASGSLGWRVSEEAFWENIKPYVSNLKIRGSYGAVGNQALSNYYPYIPTISTTTSSWIVNGGKVSTVKTPSIVNQDMTWEKIRTLNIGVDLGFLQNDLTASFDWFERKNVGMLVPANEVVHYAGYPSYPLENGGDLKTTGWEFQLNYNHIFDNDLSVYGTFTLSDSKAKITKWNGATGILTSHYKGERWGEIWGFETEGYWGVNDDPKMIEAYQGKYLAKKGFVYGPGDIKYKDRNGDGTITTGKGTIDDHGDLKRIGNQLPRYEYALRLGAAWKGFDLEVLFQGVGKRDMWTYSTLFTPHSEGSQLNIFSNQLDYWTPENQNARFPRPYIGHTGSTVSGLPNIGCNNYYPQTKYLANLAYLRLKNLTVGYTLPAKLTKKAWIEKVRVYVSGENLITWDHIDGVMDPELTGGWSSSYTNGIDYHYAGRAVPFNRQWSFGVQVTF